MSEDSGVPERVERTASTTRDSRNGVRWQDLSKGQKRFGIVVSVLTLAHLGLTGAFFVSDIQDETSPTNKGRSSIYDLDNAASVEDKPTTTTSTVAPTTIATSTTYKPPVTVPPRSSYGSGYGNNDDYSYSADASDTDDEVYYRNCLAARAAGAAPVYRYEPGYGSHLDRDSDGIGCE